jgi:membrane protein required for colicin V production
MIIDIIFVALMVLAVFKGLRNGLVVALFSFLAFIIGLAAAMKLSVVVAEYLADNTNISQKWLPVLAFIIVFFFVVLLVRLGAKAIEGALRMVMLGWLNKIGGIIFYALLYLFIFSILLFYAQQLKIIKPQVAEVSASFKYIYPLAPKVMDWLGAVLPFFRDMFASLESFFGKLSQKS